MKATRPVLLVAIMLAWYALMLLPLRLLNGTSSKVGQAFGLPCAEGASVVGRFAAGAGETPALREPLLAG